MECQMQSTIPSNGLGMGFGWHPEAFSTLNGSPEYDLDAANAGMQFMPDYLDVNAKFANALTPTTQCEPSMPIYGSFGDTMDPTTLWPSAMENTNMPSLQPSMLPAIQTDIQLPTQRASLSSSPITIAPRPSATRPPRSSSTITSTIPEHSSPSTQPSSLPSSTPNYSAASASPSESAPTESDKTRRARYAANQRHSKAQQARKDSQQNESPTEANNRADERKQRHREKNKVAAAKCRSRQRKQVQTIQQKGTRLGEQNAELKATIQELRRDLNELRSMALDHQQCNCHVAQYNHAQAERVVAEYRSSCNRAGFGTFGRGEFPEQKSFKSQ